MQTDTPVYERIVLKLSGEAMQEPGARDNISLSVVRDIAVRIKEVRDLDVQVAIVIGGGNIWRGLSASHRGMDRTTADYMGMLATVINALALRSTLDHMGVETRVQTAIDMRNVAEPFILGRAIRHLELGRIVVFDMYKPGSLRDVVLGRKVGTLVCDETPSDVKIQPT